MTDARRIAEKWLDGTGYTDVAYGVHALTEDETTTLAREYLAALARVAALEDALRTADALLGGMWSDNEQSRANLSHTWPVMASDAIRAALAPSVPRTLETDLREDR